MAHSRHQLPVDEQLIVEGDFRFESGRAAVAKLVSSLGSSIKSLDAIVASNDRMAIGVMLALRERGMSVPGDMAVTGFDDIAEAELTHPPLSTVRQAMPRLGREAMRSVLEANSARNEGDEPSTGRGNGAPALLRLQRAGNEPYSTDAAGSSNWGGSLLLHRERIHLELTRVSQGTLGAAGRGWEQRLFTGIVDASSAARRRRVSKGASGSRRATFARRERAQVSRRSRAGAAATVGSAVGGVTNQAARDRLEALIHASRTMLFEMSQRAMHNERIGLLRSNRNVATICNSLSCAFDYGELQNAIRTNLPLLRIRSAFVALFDPADAQHARLACVFDGDSDWSRFQGQAFAGADLLPKALASVSGQLGRSYTVHVLVSRGQLLGHLLLELELGSLSVTSAVATAIAGGLQRVQLGPPRLPA